jgi:hypothetical protein
MSFLGRLFGRSGRVDSSDGDQHAFLYYLRCARCGEVIRVRIDRRWDLEQEFDEGSGDAATGYAARKEVMGTKCFQMLRLTVEYDRSYHEADKQLSGGTFVGREEYEAAQAAARSAQAAEAPTDQKPQ